MAFRGAPRRVGLGSITQGPGMGYGAAGYAEFLARQQKGGRGGGLSRYSWDDEDGDGGGRSGGSGGGGSSSRSGGGSGGGGDDDEVERARKLGEVAAKLSEDSKSADFGRQRTIDSERFGRDRQAAAEDDAFDRGKMSLSSTLRRDEMKDSDRYDRGKMRLGADLEENRRSNALKSALSVLERYR